MGKDKEKKLTEAEKRKIKRCAEKVFNQQRSEGLSKSQAFAICTDRIAHDDDDNKKKSGQRKRIRKKKKK